jgi:hemerythrin superfamily protein
MLGTSFDVIDLLTRDHRQLEQLLDDLDREEQPIPASVFFVRIVRELAAHERAEQEIVFPAFRSALPAADAEEHERLGEHGEINELLAEMRKLVADEPGFDARAAALRLGLQAHFRAEEVSVFPRLRACLNRHQLVELAEQVMTARDEQPETSTTSPSRGGHR